MCGLAGIARVDGAPLTPDVDPILRRMALTIGHRGPDDRELIREGEVGLAFTRLSLVDPDGGAQPLVSADGSLVLIANGEIYNHRELAGQARLSTGSDCEVLLHLYAVHGPRFLDQVRGMFAIVLWDRRGHKLILARDRFGIKPLYFHRDAERVVFASEIKALFADPRTPRELDWERGLAHPMAPGSQVFAPFEQTTWFRDVESVPAATIMEIDLATGAAKQAEYWRLPRAGNGPVLTDAEYVERYGSLLAESVADCATADAELGLFLSGGVDSGCVAALAAGHTDQLHTFTVLCGGTLRNGDAENGKRVADFLGLPNHQVVFDSHRVPSVEEWKRLLWLLESPQCGAEMFYKHELHRYAKISRPELRGMLLGAASDEFNGGYSVVASGGEGWASFLGVLQSLLLGGHSSLLKTPGDVYDFYLARQYAQVQQYNCWHEDRTAAGSGIEARVPFLDHRLVELSVGVPRAQRERLLWDKKILRDAVRHLLPAGIVDREKVPFYFGDGEHHTYQMLTRMLLRDGAALVEEALAAPGARDLLHAAGVRALVSGVAEQGGQGVELALWTINLGLLSGMAAEIPPPIVQRPVEITPVTMEVEDWAGTLPEQLGLHPPIDGDVVLEFVDGVLFVRTVPGDDWYLLVDGAIEYIVDDELSAWRRFLAAVDGQRPVDAILTEVGCRLDDVRDVLALALEQRILTMRRDG